MYTYCGVQLAPGPQLWVATEAEYMPAAQLVQAVASDKAEYCPAGQLVQEDWPTLAWYMPAAQAVQAVAAEAEYFPAGQGPPEKAYDAAEAVKVHPAHLVPVAPLLVYRLNDAPMILSCAPSTRFTTATEPRT